MTFFSGYFKHKSTAEKIIDLVTQKITDDDILKNRQWDPSLPSPIRLKKRDEIIKALGTVLEQCFTKDGYKRYQKSAEPAKEKLRTEIADALYAFIKLKIEANFLTFNNRVSHHIGFGKEVHINLPALFTNATNFYREFQYTVNEKIAQLNDLVPGTDVTNSML